MAMSMELCDTMFEGMIGAVGGIDHDLLAALDASIRRRNDMAAQHHYRAGIAVTRLRDTRGGRIDSHAALCQRVD